ncbi:MAG: multiheme c-type cytochrome [Acidimicrobiia bacterium]|nr:multiheme c-type cytochrome [Acidimicrobiia bacterium]
MSRARILIVGGVLAVLAIVWWTQRSDDEPALTIVPAAIAADAEFDSCLECHDDLNASIEAGRVMLIGFNHQEHFAARSDVGCGTCHGLDTHDRTPPRVPTMDGCLSCHKDEGEAPQFPCLRCHDTTTVAPPQSHFVSDWSSRHGSGALLSQALCETCHSQENFCTACHGTEIPHQSAWSGTLHAEAVPKLGIASCERCHERGPDLTVRDDCDACHHPQIPSVPSWRDAHPEVVLEGGGTSCFSCHSPDTCVTCHTTGVEDFGADYSRMRAPDLEAEADG